LIDLKCKVAPENRKSYCGNDIRQKLSDPPQMTNLAGRKKSFFVWALEKPTLSSVY